MLDEYGLLVPLNNLDEVVTLPEVLAADDTELASEDSSLVVLLVV